MNRHQQPGSLPKDFTRFELSDVESTVPERFHRVATDHSDRVAVDDSTRLVSYRELANATSHVAAWIIDRLGPEPEPVALIYRHGPSFNIAQFGVMKSGKFYASLDAELSLERLTLLLQNLGARLILCDSECAQLASDLAAQVPGSVVLNTESLDTSSAVRRPAIEITPDSIAYIVYTSGSTGDPQGVVVSHRNILHFTMNSTNNLHLRPADLASQICPLASAACAGETFPILLNGAALMPFAVKIDGITNVLRLLRWVKRAKITVFTSVPVLFRLLVGAMRSDERLPDVRLIHLSGDRILAGDADLLKRHFGPDCLLRAALGAAECLLYSQFFIDSQYEPTHPTIPAGYALDGMDISVVDADMNRMPAGTPGEIAVKSRYLSLGYWQNPERTAERFRADPDGGNERTYMTRDWGYLEEDGCLIHLGRTDSRVKIYGKMVSMTDVEEALLDVAGVKEAVVVARDTGAHGHVLIAYYTSDSKSDLSHADLRAGLRQRFPSEVIPKEFIRLDAIPVTKSNKIDRRKLTQDSARSAR
jgi:amino acid adenylation domain-containing protein